MTDQLTRDLVAATTPPPTTFDVDRIARDGRARRRRRATVMTGLAAVTVAAVVTVVALPNQRHAPSTLIDNRTPTASPPQRQYIGPGLPCSSDYELRVNDEQVAYFGVREIAPAPPGSSCTARPHGR